MLRRPHNKLHRCKKCGTNDPAHFRRGRFSICKTCHNAYVVDKYHEASVAQGKTTKRFGPYKPREVRPNADEIAAAAKFGLTVPQYRAALREAQS